MSQACSRSFFEYARNAVRVCVDLMLGTTVISSVTIRAIASCSATSTIATRSHSPETEYTWETPSIPANFVAHWAILWGSALIKTMAVINDAPGYALFAPRLPLGCIFREQLGRFFAVGHITISA